MSALCQTCWHSLADHPGVKGCAVATTFSTGHVNACRCTQFKPEHMPPDPAVAVCDNCTSDLTSAEVDTDTHLCAECLADELALDFAQEQAEERARDRARGDR